MVTYNEELLIGLHIFDSPPSDILHYVFANKLEISWVSYITLFAN